MPNHKVSTDGQRPLIIDPMKPEAVDGYVEAVDPPETAMKMTADAAEISGLRLMDAAAEARERN